MFDNISESKNKTMKYEEILKQLKTIQEQMYNDGCNPVADQIAEAIDELNYAQANNLIK